VLLLTLYFHSIHSLLNRLSLLFYTSATLDRLDSEPTLTCYVSQVLTAQVKSVEDHGYILYFGVSTFSGFMPKADKGRHWLLLSQVIVTIICCLFIYYNASYWSTLAALDNCYSQSNTVAYRLIAAYFLRAYNVNNLICSNFVLLKKMPARFFSC
jgi:hypothetical protein